MDAIGREIARMHGADVVHGDLTTSNMMLRARSSSKGAELVRGPEAVSYFSLAHGAAAPRRFWPGIHLDVDRRQGC